MATPRHFWWVNQNQTFRYEVPGGYLWSPKRNNNGRPNPFYDSMREVSPGDVIFSFAGAHIKAIGIAQSHGYEAPKPLEFGSKGAYWDNIGWRVDVGFAVLRHVIRPSRCMDILGPLLPRRYSPLQSTGAGLQGIYLTPLPDAMAGALIDLIGVEARNLVNAHLLGEITPSSPAIGLVEWEEHQLEQIRSNDSIADTERLSLVLSRRGQGVFKERVMHIERRCRITKVDREEHLRASHCKPWRDATNGERLDGENGLLLTPDADHLFDRGFIAFEDNGDVLVSPVAHKESLRKMGLGPELLRNVGTFTQEQRRYLHFHRDSVFLKSKFFDDI